MFHGALQAASDAARFWAVELMTVGSKWIISYNIGSGIQKIDAQPEQSPFSIEICAGSMMDVMEFDMGSGGNRGRPPPRIAARLAAGSRSSEAKSTEGRTRARPPPG